MGLGAEFLVILKDTVRLTDSVDRLNGVSVKLQDQVRDIDKRVVRLETLVEVAKTKALRKPSPSK